MAKPSKDEFLMQAIETVVDMAAQSTERIADLLPADLFAPSQPEPQEPVQPNVMEQPLFSVDESPQNPDTDMFGGML